MAPSCTATGQPKPLGRSSEASAAGLPAVLHLRGTRSTPNWATRDDQPGYDPRNLLVGEEEGGGVSSAARPSEGEGNQTRRWATCFTRLVISFTLVRASRSR